MRFFPGQKWSIEGVAKVSASNPSCGSPWVFLLGFLLFFNPKKFARNVIELWKIHSQMSGCLVMKAKRDILKSLDNPPNSLQLQLFIRKTHGFRCFVMFQSILGNNNFSMVQFWHMFMFDSCPSRVWASGRALESLEDFDVKLLSLFFVNPTQNPT